MSTIITLIGALGSVLLGLFLSWNNMFAEAAYSQATAILFVLLAKEEDD